MLSSQFVDSVRNFSNAQKISVEKQKALTIDQMNQRPEQHKPEDDISVQSSSKSAENALNSNADQNVRKSNQSIKFDEQVSNKSEKD